MGPYLHARRAAKLLPKTVREWAYAGFTFDLVAAIVSYLAMGRGSHVPPPAFALVLALASYFTRRRVTEGAASEQGDPQYRTEHRHPLDRSPT